MQRGTIRHFKSIVEERVREIENEAKPRPQHKKPGIASRQFPIKKIKLDQTTKPKLEKLVRQKEDILFKKKNELPLFRAKKENLMSIYGTIAQISPDVCKINVEGQ